VNIRPTPDSQTQPTPPAVHRSALFASLAVTAAASLTSLTDPAQVAADWNRTLDDARQPILAPGPLGLTASGPGSLTFRAEPTAPTPFFRAHPAPPTEADATSPAKENNRDVLVVPGDLDPKILHQVSGDMDPKILHGGTGKRPDPRKLFKPVDPRLQPPPGAPAEPSVADGK